MSALQMRKEIDLLRSGFFSDRVKQHGIRPNIRTLSDREILLREPTTEDISLYRRYGPACSNRSSLYSSTEMFFDSIVTSTSPNGIVNVKYRKSSGPFTCSALMPLT